MEGWLLAAPNAVLLPVRGLWLSSHLCMVGRTTRPPGGALTLLPPSSAETCQVDMNLAPFNRSLILKD